MRAWECTQTDTRTEANWFYNLSHAICYSYGTDNRPKRLPQSPIALNLRVAVHAAWISSCLLCKSNTVIAHHKSHYYWRFGSLFRLNDANESWAGTPVVTKRLRSSISCDAAVTRSTTRGIAYVRSRSYRLFSSCVPRYGDESRMIINSRHSVKLLKYNANFVTHAGDVNWIAEFTQRLLSPVAIGKRSTRYTTIPSSVYLSACLLVTLVDHIKMAVHVTTIFTARRYSSAIYVIYNPVSVRPSVTRWYCI